MARASLELIEALKKTARQLGKSNNYQWGHMGSCNCGYLAQEITKLNKSEIHSRAMQKYGDWNDQLNDYCPTSGLLMDDLITELLSAGLDLNDLKHLEKLSDSRVLRVLPKENRYLQHNSKTDVVTYINAWAIMLENQLLDSVKLPPLEKEIVPV
ncbi:MAG: hypothetical protein AAGA02_07095 [Bacteroidota bacterium]